MRRARPRLWLPPNAAQRGELDFWPRCLVCDKAVHYYEVVDEGEHRMEILARCTHEDNPRGPYKKQHFDALRIEWSGPRPDDETMRRQIQTLEFFSPREES